MPPYPFLDSIISGAMSGLRGTGDVDLDTKMNSLPRHAEESVAFSYCAIMYMDYIYFLAKILGVIYGFSVYLQNTQKKNR